MKITKQTVMPAEGGLSMERDPRGGNSQTHGILSTHVPASEREAYTAHAQAVRQSSGSQGYLQDRLADRAALALWRLDRVARWEAQQMEADLRRWNDRQQVADPFAALHSAQYEGQPINARDLGGTLEALAELTGESARTFLTDPDTATLYATDTDLEAEGWAALESGELGTLSVETVGTLGIELLQALMTVWKVSPAKVGRVLLGRKPTATEAESLEEWDWEITLGDLPELLKLCRQAAGAGWAKWALYKRYDAIGKATKLRMLADRLPMLIQQEQARTVEPSVERLEKIARYEAHLERVLYRALHELEAARRERQGQDTPGPLRMVLDERADQ